MVKKTRSLDKTGNTNKILLIAFGMMAFAIFLLAMQLTYPAIAHQNRFDNRMVTLGINGNAGNNHMLCMSGQLSLEEMDENNDGKCDMCGMPISECEEMREHMEEHEAEDGEWEVHDGMMQNHRGMNCHM